MITMLIYIAIGIILISGFLILCELIFPNNDPEAPSKEFQYHIGDDVTKEYRDGQLDVNKSSDHLAILQKFLDKYETKKATPKRRRKLPVARRKQRTSRTKPLTTKRTEKA